MILEIVKNFLVLHQDAILIGLVVIAKELLEYWLGKTKKVEAGSSAELVILLVKKILRVFKI